MRLRKEQSPASPSNLGSAAYADRQVRTDTSKVKHLERGNQVPMYKNSTSASGRNLRKSMAKELPSAMPLRNAMGRTFVRDVVAARTFA
jgi:hypothetical protein